MKVAILWSHPSSYLRGCIKQLELNGDDLLVSLFQPNNAAPYSANLTSSNRQCEWVVWPDGAVDAKKLIARVNAFSPDIILISGWNHSAYIKVAGELTSRSTVRVLCMDNPWEETARQKIGRLLSPILVRKYFDHAFVGGERQRQFARRLGFSDAQISEGVFTADPELFHCQIDFSERPDQFIFVGRYVEEKGLSDLLRAYGIYRRNINATWSLKAAGTGPLRGLVTGEGVTDLGFIQPEHLNLHLNQSKCLVAPSRWEPWGVQIHEAICAGLPVICTAVCGSAVHLVRDGFNGKIFEAGKVGDLAEAMGEVTRRVDLQAWSSASLSLSGQFTPKIWAEKVRFIARQRRPERVGG